jgi:biotin carboxyl carrier protein
MLKVKVNETEFSVENQKLNEVPFEWDLLDYKDGTFHILKDNVSYKASLLKMDEDSKSMVLSVNGNEYSVSLKDKYDILLEKLGMNSMSSSKVNNIKAPMPGLVFDIKVTEGDTIKKGDTVLVLEAMKMENMLKSPGEGVVKTIKVKKGEAVEKNQILIELA